MNNLHKLLTGEISQEQFDELEEPIIIDTGLIPEFDFYLEKNDKTTHGNLRIIQNTTTLSFPMVTLKDIKGVATRRNYVPCFKGLATDEQLLEFSQDIFYNKPCAILIRVGLGSSLKITYCGGTINITAGLCKIAMIGSRLSRETLSSAIQKLVDLRLNTPEELQGVRSPRNIGEVHEFVENFEKIQN